MSVASVLSKSGKINKVVGIPGYKLNKPVALSHFTGTLGLEVELEGTGLPGAGYLETVRSPSGATWEAAADGSLRGGIEYKLTQPCEPDEVLLLLNGLFDVFKARKTVLRPSNRCSLHVHYNVGNMRVNSITSIIALWAIFEEPLLRWWGDARYKNHFCLSTKDEEATLQAWESFLKTGRLPDDRNLRYSALNLVSIRQYGSLEFRGGGAVEDPNRAAVWIELINRLCKYAERNYHSPKQIAYDLSERGPVAIFKDICGEDLQEFADEIVAGVPDFFTCCYDSFHNIQPLLFDFPWDKWLEEIGKPYVPNPFEGGKIKEAMEILNAARPARLQAPQVDWVLNRNN